MKNLSCFFAKMVLVCLLLGSGCDNSMTDKESSPDTQGNTPDAQDNTQESKTDSTEDSTELPPIECEGELFSFTVVDPENMPSAQELDLEWDISWKIVDSSSSKKIRLDFCQTAEDELSLERIVYKQWDFSGLRIYRPDPERPIQGLQEALFGEHQGLYGTVPEEGATGSGLLLKGSQDEFENSFVSVLDIRFDPDGSYNPTTSKVLVGIFELGDPFLGSECLFHETHQKSSFTLGTARFETEQCTYLGGGFTTGYYFTKMTVTDKNGKLSPEEQQPVSLEGDDLKQALTFAYNHHNACDSFYLVLPHAAYAATSAATAGCGGIVDEAPQRDHTDPRMTVLYKIRYHDQTWSEIQELACEHYLFHCE